MNDGMCFSRKRMEAGQAGQHLSLLKLSRDCIPNWPILSLGLLCFCRHFLEDKVLLLLRYDNYGSYLLPPPTLARYQRQREKETCKKLNEVIFFRIRNALQVFARTELLSQRIQQDRQFISFLLLRFSSSITYKKLANEGDTSASKDHDRWTRHQGRQPV